MDIQFKRLLLCLILSLGGLAMAGCATTTSQAATVSGQVTPAPVATATLPLGATRVSIRVNSPEIVLSVAPVSVAEAEATPTEAEAAPTEAEATPTATEAAPTAVSSQADERVQATAEPSEGRTIERGVEVAGETFQRRIMERGVERGVEVAGETYQAQGRTYVVCTGDNLYRIAKRFGLTVEQLAAANGIVHPHYIQVGQTLIIPSASAPPGGGTYLVCTGDNLYRIAKRFGLTVEDIAAANGIAPPYCIKVGQTLIIPGYAPPTPPLLPTWTPTPTWTPPWWTPTPTWTPPWWTPTPTWTPPWWPPTPTGTPPAGTPTPTVGPGMELSDPYTRDGKFSIQYPSAWWKGVQSWQGYFIFWANERGYPPPVLIGVASKSNGQRGSDEVLRDYKEILLNMLGTRLGQITGLSWEGEPERFLIGDNMGWQQYGRITTSDGEEFRIRLIAAVSMNNRREYMILTTAPSNLWDGKQYIMGEMIRSFRFLP